MTRLVQSAYKPEETAFTPFSSPTTSPVYIMASQPRPFMQVDVFPSSKLLSGDPVAVVLNGEGVSTETMRKFASWTNLSETTFIQAATVPRADYKLRIFTTTRELPFAGHPTLGSCKAWLENGGKPKNDGKIIQECGIGLVTIKFDLATGRLSFAAPDFLREGEVSAEDLKLMCDAMSIDTSEVLSSRWIDNGPGWAGLLLNSADAVLAVKTHNMNKANSINWGIVGAYDKAQDRVRRSLKGEKMPSEPDSNDDGLPHFELRAFASKEVAFMEDPVTGSLKWFINREYGKVAAWTNLAETTFVEAPSDPSADYKLRIFTITQELPFAGHPTLGSCKAWLEGGGHPKKEGEIIQECGIGLVVIKLDSSSGRLSFAAAGFLREGDVSGEDLARMCNAMNIRTQVVLASR
ncbi:unnamed protein product [Rhizoctonia solani]|uniref:Uncharacterized protein n=1 Tax=Rhizoctonia solani TaxID=456999 RepID=A0A8H3BWZ9_9AGAM|nr:unnamed protein product [Rhizoctonia solani]